MDPVTLGSIAAIGSIGAGGAALLSKPGVPNIPPPIKPASEPIKAKPRPKASMQDSFLTGVAGTGPADTPRRNSLLGQ